MEDQSQPWNIKRYVKPVSGTNLEQLLSSLAFHFRPFLKVRAEVKPLWTPYRCSVSDTEKGGEAPSVGRGQSGNGRQGSAQSHPQPIWAFFPHYAQPPPKKNNEMDNQALKGLMIFCGPLRCCSRGSTKQSAAGHPASRPVRARVSTAFTTNHSMNDYGTSLPLKNEVSALCTSPLGHLLITYVLPHLAILRPVPVGSWSEASSDSAERRYMGNDFKVKPDMMDTRRTMLDWPLVYATLGMPTGFPTALWRTRQSWLLRGSREELVFDSDLNSIRLSIYHKK